METREEIIKKAAEEAMREKPDERVLSFTAGGEKFWIKRKMGNGRRGAVKYSVEKEFYYEIARMTIAGRNTPHLVAPVEVLTPSYMVTKDGGPTLKNWLDSEKTEAEKIQLLEKAGEALATLHEADIVHGRPALRDICWQDGKFTFLDWENRMYAKDLEEQKAVDFFLLLQGLGRESYKEERSRMEALDRGYCAKGGTSVRDEAIRFLKRHSILCGLTQKLKPFHMKDVESVRKVYEYLMESE